MGRACAGARGMPRSHAFLLRCWQEPGGILGERPEWRYCLTHISRNREVRGFVDLKDVMAYLRQALEDEEHQQTDFYEDGTHKERSK